MTEQARPDTARLDGQVVLAWQAGPRRGARPTITARRGDEILLCERADLLDPADRQRVATRIHQLAGIAPGQAGRALLQFAGEFARSAESDQTKTDQTDDSTPADPEALLQQMPAAVQAEARAMLEAPDLLERIGRDFSAVGIAGERCLAGTIYLTGVSRLLERPLALLIQGPSSSGKSYVPENVARLFPPESLLVATSMSPQAIYYAKPGTFRHRFVVAGERSRKTDDEAAEVTRALRQMLSEGRLSRLVTVKRSSGPPTAELVEQEGPIAYVESTTLATGDVFVEDLNRMLLLATDETPEQTKRVLRSVAAKYHAPPAGDAERVIQRHHALHRMLRPHRVTIPYAEALMEALPATRLEIRRGAGYILAMIEASALLHQYQRQEYADGTLLATLDDYRLARALLAEPLGRLLGRRVADGALRFLRRLVEWFDVGGEYTLPEARRREEHSPSAVYLWNSDLLDAGLVEMVEAKKGNAPARWRVLLSPDAAEDSLSVLPEPEEIG